MIYQNAGNNVAVRMIAADARHILDVGCGAGDNARSLLADDPKRRIIGITLSQEEAAIAENQIVSPRRIPCAARVPVVAKANRSEAADRIARAKRTDDGLPVHSFRSLLGELATVTRNTMAMMIHPTLPS